MDTAQIVIGPDGTVLAASGGVPKLISSTRASRTARNSHAESATRGRLSYRLPQAPGRVAREDVTLDDGGSLVQLLAIEACAIRRRATDLRALLTSKLTVISSQALSAHVTLRIVVAADVPSLVRVDSREDRLGSDNARRQRLALRNQGARQKPGGTINVRASFDPATGVTIEVQDDGPGIPADSVARLFKRDGLNVLGSGLALLVMSDVLAVMENGSTCRAGLDPVAHGTTVRLTLPAA